MLPFFALKGLSFLPFGGFLKNPKVLLAIVLVAALAFAYFKWKGAIEERVYNELYTQQAEQLIKNQQKELERTQRLQQEANRAVEEARKRREALLLDVERARAKARQAAPEEDGKVAPVLKDALEWIREQEGFDTVQEAPGATLGEQAGEALDQGLEAAQEVLESTGNDAIDAWKKLQGEER